MAAADARGEVYSYRQRKGAQESTYTWTRAPLQPGRFQMTATRTASDEFDKMICDASYNIIEWFYSNKKKQISIHAVKKNGSIHISGDVKGKPLKKIIRLETAAWHQVPEFAISRMLAARQNSMTFSMFWLDKMSFFMMKAERIGEEIIRIDGKEIDTIKVRMALTGFRSVFWSSKYWFRKSDYLIVRYVGVNGLPGTDATVIELFAR